MPQRRYIVSILFGFGTSAPFAFSSPWIFSALRCTSLAFCCSRLLQSLTFRSVPCCFDAYRSFVAPRSASRRRLTNCPADTVESNFFLLALRCTGASPHLPVKQFSLKQPKDVPTFTSSTRRRCGECVSQSMAGNGVFRLPSPVVQKSQFPTTLQQNK